jgi:hypothetical protein
LISEQDSSGGDSIIIESGEPEESEESGTLEDE